MAMAMDSFFSYFIKIENNRAVFSNATYTKQGVEKCLANLHRCKLEYPGALEQIPAFERALKEFENNKIP